MTLEKLKEELEQRYNCTNDIKIKTGKRGSKSLAISDVLLCYYDDENKMYYGRTYHWWLNKSCSTCFYIPVEQVNWLFKRLDKLHNCLNRRNEQ